MLLAIFVLARDGTDKEVFSKKDVLKYFAKFTGKQLCRSLFLIKLDAEAYNIIKKETMS